MSIKFSKAFVSGQIIFWGLALIITAGFLIIRASKEYDRSGYRQYLPAYLEEPQNLLLHQSKVPPESVVVRGKLMVVNLNSRSVDPVFSSLPKELKPETPEQVKTVLWVTCEPKMSSLIKYTDGRTGIENECQLIFIDFPNKKYLWRNTIRVYPPTSRKRSEAPAAPDPGEEILRYLEKIPRQE